MSTIAILQQLYCSLIYPFLTYGLSVWGNTYSTTLRLLLNLQKRAIRITTFSKPDEHSEPLFKALGILNLTDLVILHNTLFMYQYHNNLLPTSFKNFTKQYRQDMCTMPGLLLNQHIILIRSKQTMGNSTSALQVQKFGIKWMKI